jgi:hypothetical protein
MGIWSESDEAVDSLVDAALAEDLEITRERLIVLNNIRMQIRFAKDLNDIKRILILIVDAMEKRI